MESLISAVTPRPPALAKRTAEVDFRSGAVLEQLSAQVLELVQLEQAEFGDQTALEVHTAKDFIFNMLGLVQKVDQRLPVANEYLLLSGGAREGVLDLNPEDLGDYAKGADFDMDFTLLVPALKLHDRNQPVTLDMRQSGPCHSWLSLRLCDPVTLARWRFCCQEEHEAGLEEDGAEPDAHAEPGRATIPSLQSPQVLDGCYFSPTLVADWFWDVVGMAVEELRKNPQRGTPVPERVERNGPLTTLVLTAGTSRVLYDLLPVVSFRGWPAVAQGWLTANHFWDGKITEEEAISGFYLLPCCSPAGGRPDREWRLAFSRSEVQLKKCIPSPMAQAFQAAKALISRLLSRPRSGLSPYHLRTMLFWACDRLPPAYLSSQDPEIPARLLLGLLDDLAHCILGKSCPNYFLPQYNMLDHLSDSAALLLARKLAHLRSDPAEHLRAALDQARQVSQLKREAAGSNGHPLSPRHGSGTGHVPQDDRLAQRLQQLVTENPGKSISVFLNPDDVTRPHFRIDDKFY
ncbi:transmembrane protein 102 isoform X1 [Brienomyrus brachyistius]|uniref:transmembrane protein 102 isoform X1 n=1 Tax=Brienomyrus brachyistius TaxID=42636 RepID=UPI0020B403C1|nr:transmembrane protein 102 isoform X1 [Brienomyrus brachyistius]XP_048885274.1 transmembrane protein 102 isoform X1 [Brienomyrus brachyistius]